MISMETIQTLASEHGLAIRGSFPVTQDDRVPDIDSLTPSASLVLFGNVGSSIWQVFRHSPEYADGQPDPLNRWSERIGKAIAARLGGLALFPFGGPPYLPFLSWAGKAEHLKSSKLGMLIHPEYGLWHAYRFAIALPEICSFERAEGASDICAQCPDQPCLKGCPVNAFSGSEYDVEACYRYLDRHPMTQCMKTGCQARVSCPKGARFRYQGEHAAFHMEAFRQSMKQRFNRAKA